MNVVTRGRSFARGWPLGCALVLCFGGCKRDPAPKPVAPAAQQVPVTPVAVASDGGPALGTPAPRTPVLPPTARFATLAAFRQQPLFAPFAEFVESDDDLEDGETPAAPAQPAATDTDAEAGDDGDADADAEDGPSPDRPPTDVQLTRLQFPGEVYDLSYEENCGDGLEDRRNLHHVVLERRGAQLVQLMRYALCGDSRRGFSLDVQRLGPSAPELLVRTFRLEADGGGEVALRAFARVGGVLTLVGAVEESSNTAARFEVDFEGSVVDVKLVTVGDDADEVQHRRYVLRAEGFVAAATAVAPAPKEQAPTVPPAGAATGAQRRPRDKARGAPDPK